MYSFLYTYIYMYNAWVIDTPAPPTKTTTTPTHQLTNNLHWFVLPGSLNAHPPTIHAQYLSRTLISASQAACRRNREYESYMASHRTKKQFLLIIIIRIRTRVSISIISRHCQTETTDNEFSRELFCGQHTLSRSVEKRIRSSQRNTRINRTITAIKPESPFRLSVPGRFSIFS